MTQTPPHKVIAERMKTLRKSRGWSAERLAEEMTKAGVPWDRSIVANLENGRRRTVGVDELLALADVLDVAPMQEMPGEDQRVFGFLVGNPPAPLTAAEYTRNRPLIDQAANLIVSAALNGADPAAVLDYLREQIVVSRGVDGSMAVLYGATVEPGDG